MLGGFFISNDIPNASKDDRNSVTVCDIFFLQNDLILYYIVLHRIAFSYILDQRMHPLMSFGLLKSKRFLIKK